MRARSFLPATRIFALVLGCFLVVSFTHACGGKVVAEPGTAGSGGQGGAGGGPTDACDVFGPANPDGPCKTEGASCAYGDTSCFQTWTCHAGQWSEGTGCFNSTAIAGGG
ncbi:MAG: hypothetical protein QM820_34675 [Minicystis sp.]